MFSAARLLSRKHQGERRPSAELGPDLDASAEEPREALRDVQAEPRAAVLSRETAIELRKGTEEVGNVGFVDADTGVAHREAHLRAKGIDGDAHFALVRELDRVARKV